jgi:hypothetical protein
MSHAGLYLNYQYPLQHRQPRTFLSDLSLHHRPLRPRLQYRISDRILPICQQSLWRYRYMVSGPLPQATSTPPCFRSLTSIGPTLQDRSRAHTVRVTAPTSWQLWAKPCLMQPYSVLTWTGYTPSWLLPGFKDASTRHHNLGRAPEKKVKHASSSSGGKNKTQTYKPKPTAPQASSGATPTRKRLCYI